MKKSERQSFECNIKSNLLVVGQGVWECMGVLKYKIENEETIDDTEIRELLRKLTTVRDASDSARETVINYFSKFSK
jgi:hypothetical protein